MNKKSVFASLLGILLFGILFGYSLVFAGFTKSYIPTQISFSLSNNIYMDGFNLNKTKILFKSSDDLSNYKILSTCDIFSKKSYEKGDYYMFDLKFFDNSCTNKDFLLIDSNNQVKFKFKLNLLSEYGIYSKMIDLKTSKLVQFKNILEEKIKNNLKYSKYDQNIEKNYYKYLEKNRLLNETLYNKEIIDNILNKRDDKYIVPVIGSKMPTKLVKIPNSGRGYRNNYTDGIHHGWDIDGKFGENIVSLDDSIVVRVVNGFVFSDLNGIERGNNLSNFVKAKNLDTLRGNQVWLKTMSGDVVMYSHLNEIYSDIKEGKFIKKGHLIGTIGITGIPDKGYTDYHLHFAVHSNPFTSNNYSIEDYMSWDWLFKGNTQDYILKNWNNYFES